MAYKGHRINPTRFEKSQIKIIVILLPLVIFMALPIIFIINHAFKPMEELFAFPPTFFVRNPTLENFESLIKASRTSGIPLSRYVFNSLIVTLVTIFLSLLLTTCAAFALSKIKFRAKNMLMNVNQTAIMFVATAVLIPRYLVISKTGMVDSYLVYLKIIIPMIKPAIATASILVFQQVWTNMETSNYFVNDDSMKTLTFYMNTLANANNTVAGQGMAAAASLIMFIPNLVLFVILQKNVMNTMAHSGIK